MTTKMAAANPNPNPSLPLPHTHVHSVRQLEQRVKTILDSIAVSDDRKRELIRGDAVDKAEQLSMFVKYGQVRFE